MKIKVGDRVRYSAAYLDGDDDVPQRRGVVVMPTAEDLEDLRNSDMATGPQHGDHMVEWSDGERYWEQPEDLEVDL